LPLCGDPCLCIEILDDTTKMEDRAFPLCLKLREKAVLFSGLKIFPHLLLNQDLHKSIYCCSQLSGKRIENQFYYNSIWMLYILAILVIILSEVASK